MQKALPRNTATVRKNYETILDVKLVDTKSRTVRIYQKQCVHTYVACHSQICYIIFAATPRQVEEGGACSMSEALSFFLSVLASIVAYYVCKWLDGDE